MSDFTRLTSFGPVPAGWMWGTATAAHQIEGGNTNNDWWDHEHTPGSGATEPSGDACDSWHRWFEDLELVRGMGLDSYRFSIEWSRVEPAPGEFSLAALEHYRQIMVAAHEMGLKNSVTFHHFTTPRWAADAGGWLNPEIADWFARYVDIAVQHLGDHIDVAATFNEPNVVANAGYGGSDFPPRLAGGPDAARTATENIVAAHLKAREALRAGPGEFPVGLTVALPDVVVHLDGSRESEGVRLIDLPGDIGGDQRWFQNDAYLDAARDDDYVGVQTYFEFHVGPDGQELPHPEGARVTQMNWSFTPESLGQAVRYAYQVAQVPIIVTENGVAAEDDDERIEYYSRSLASLREAMDDGVDVRGFYAWSLLDNFEWNHGYVPKFGLVSVDPVTFARTPKPSSVWYAGIVADSRR